MTERVISEQENNRLEALKNDKKFVNKAFWAYNWAVPMNFTKERMLGCSMTSMVARIAPDIYPDDIEKQKELCRNHEVFFNTQQGLGAVIYGIVAGMEVERAQNPDVTNELIQSIKQALASPLAGLGDSLIQVLITPIIISIGIGMSAETGSAIGPIFMIITYTAINAVLSYSLFRLGFRGGVASAEVLVGPMVKDKIIPAMEALGILVIGATTASTMNVKTALEFNVNGTVVNLQTDVLDSIFPKLLSLGVALLTFWLFRKKKWGATKTMLVFLVVAIVGYLTTILA